jgi:hypothetical protein
MDEKNIEVKLSNGNPTIKGKKQEEREEKKKKDFYLQEHRFGSFERSSRRMTCWGGNASRWPNGEHHPCPVSHSCRTESPATLVGL